MLALALLAAACVDRSIEPTGTDVPLRRTAPSLGPTESPRPTRIAAGVEPSPPKSTLAPIPPASAEEPMRGPADAPVTLIVYSDLQCLACAQLASVLQKLQALHPQDVRLVYRHFPLLQQHDKASLAAQFAELAGEQGAFWQAHDTLFERRAEWAALTPEEFLEWAVGLAQAEGLDAAAVRSGLTEGRYQNEMTTAYQQGLAMGIPSSPFLLLDGEPYLLPPQLNFLEAAVRLALLSARQIPEYPPFEVDLDREYQARLRFDRGLVVLQLYPQVAPLAVNSFVYLAGAGWFDGNAVYQVQPGLFVETGDPTGTGLGDPGYHFPLERTPTLRFDRPGMVALVPTSPESNAARFFISLTPLPELDGIRTIFGRVVQGLDVLRDLPARDPLPDLLTPPGAVLQRVEIEVRP